MKEEESNKILTEGNNTSNNNTKSTASYLLSEDLLDSLPYIDHIYTTITPNINNQIEELINKEITKEKDQDITEKEIESYIENKYKISNTTNKPNLQKINTTETPINNPNKILHYNKLIYKSICKSLSLSNENLNSNNSNNLNTLITLKFEDIINKLENKNNYLEKEINRIKEGNNSINMNRKYNQINTLKNLNHIDNEINQELANLSDIIKENVKLSKRIDKYKKIIGINNRNK